MLNSSLVYKVAVLMAAALIAMALLAMRKPDILYVHRSVNIKAAPADILPFIEDFHRWSSWSPYERLDPAMHKTYGGKSKGEGAVFEWQGNGKVGAGRMTILKVSSLRIVISLDRRTPKSHDVAEFVLRRRGVYTHVVWLVRGPYRFSNKVLGLVLNWNYIVGEDLENGLTNLKQVVETAAER
jgi:hypothetical protein